MGARTVALMLAASMSACASHLPDVPANVTSGGAPVPLAPVTRSDAAPRIVAMRFNTLDVRRGERWTGAIVTGTNVASVEVRTSLFSIDVPRTAFGRFAFVLDVLDVPPIFIRPYRLRVIARNSAGSSAEEDLPFRIR